MMDEARPHNAATPGLSGITTHVTNLLRKEAEFARAEIGERAARFGRGLGFLIFAVVLGLSAVNVIAGAAVAAVAAAGVPPVWAGLAVGGGLALLAAAAAIIGLRRVDPKDLAPRQTARNLRDDFDQVWNAVRD